LSSELRPISYAVLALIGEGGASPHDLVDYMRRGAPFFWSGAPSQVYAEPKRLERLGYLSSRKEPGRTRQRTVYRLTDRGDRALREWLAQPSPFPRVQNEASVRLMAADLGDEADVLASLRAMRQEIDRLEPLIAESEAGLAARVPHRARYVQLNYALARRLLDVHREWIEEAERELG
jgi:PadR family transcriptional regulator AphA